MTSSLPEEFSVLEPFAGRWALATEYERGAQRRRSTPAELQAFYDAILPLVPAILKRADRYPVGKVEGVDRTLFHMALSLVEIAPHVEFYHGNPLVPFAFQEDRMLGAHCADPD
ncbi:MAG TPA: hypothetical protein VGB91_03735 [Rhizomicrobium sp.]